MHWLDFALLLFLILAVLRGFRSGFVTQAIELGSIVLACYIADPFSLLVIDLLSKMSITIPSGWLTWFIAFVIAGYLIRALLRFLLKDLGSALGLLNKVGGAILSLLTTAMIFVVLLNLYVALAPRYQWSSLPENSTIAPKLQDFGETILPTRLFIQKGVEKHLPPHATPTPNVGTLHPDTITSRV